MKNLIITNTEFNTEYGFFFVEFSNGKSIQCCLIEKPRLDGEFSGYEEKISHDDNGFDEGVCLDCNSWAIELYGKDAVNSYLVEVSRK